MLSLIVLLILNIQHRLRLTSGSKRARILKAYLKSWIARLSHSMSGSGAADQIDLMSIRQALASVLFGRGVLHS